MKVHPNKKYGVVITEIHENDAFVGSEGRRLQGRILFINHDVTPWRYKRAMEGWMYGDIGNVYFYGVKVKYVALDSKEADNYTKVVDRYAKYEEDF